MTFTGFASFGSRIRVPSVISRKPFFGPGAFRFAVRDPLPPDACGTPARANPPPDVGVRGAALFDGVVTVDVFRGVSALPTSTRRPPGSVTFGGAVRSYSFITRARLESVVRLPYASA